MNNKTEAIHNAGTISPWAIAACEVQNLAEPLDFKKELQGYAFTLHLYKDSLWVIAQKARAGRVALRVAYSPSGELKLTKVVKTDDHINVVLESLIGEVMVTIDFLEPKTAFFRYTTSLKPKLPLSIPFWPRDVVIMGAEKNGTLLPEGQLHVHQTGLRSGLLYLTMDTPKTGSMFYFQNLSSLNPYFEETGTSGKDVVGGQWPELGFALPPTKERPIPAGNKMVISDAFIILHPEQAKNEFEMSKQFLDMHAQVYLHLDLPPTKYPDWCGIAEKSLKDLQECAGCWSHADGHNYLNAYLSDFKNPPESMVQLAVLLPLREYATWQGEDIPLAKKIEEGLPAFYDEKLGTMARWLPSKEKELDGSEEHKKPNVMDSWYLFHPLLNLSRMALHGDKVAKKLFLDSMDYAIKVAHRFNYRWPVFYKMDDLEVVKAEAKPGAGGENDVAGIYAHVMLEAWDLTGEKRYLEEAKKSARSLQGLGFNLFYQANNTAFATGAMLRLWKETKDELYLDLCYLCLANLYKNIGIWECRYGHGKYHSSIFALFPLNDAPYTAVYEEQEAFAAFNYFLYHSKDEPILPSVKLLLAEFIRLLTHKAVYYYPPLLPRDMLVDECKTGELDTKVWVPIEDLQDGWKQCGEVGQEVYGVGQAFGILTRQYKRVADDPFMVFIDYPTFDFSAKKGKPVTFTIGGDQRFGCKMRLIPFEDGLPANIVVLGKSAEGEEEFKGKPTKEGHLEYNLKGEMHITISWNPKKSLFKVSTEPKKAHVCVIRKIGK